MSGKEVLDRIQTELHVFQRTEQSMKGIIDEKVLETLANGVIVQVSKLLRDYAEEINT